MASTVSAVSKVWALPLVLLQLTVLTIASVGCGPTMPVRRDGTDAQTVSGTGGVTGTPAGGSGGLPSGGAGGASAGTGGTTGSGGMADGTSTTSAIDAQSTSGGQPGGGGAGPPDAGTGGAGPGVTDAATSGAGGAGGNLGLDGQGSAALDAASADAPAAIGCTGSSFALCEDFEGAVIDATTWRIVAQNGTVTLDPARGAQGSQRSVHVHVDPGGSTAVGLVESKTFPALKGGFFARAFIYIPSTDKDLNFTGDRHTRLFYAAGGSPYGEYALGIWQGGLIQNHYSPTGDSKVSMRLPPFDEWFCLEYELDSTAGRVAAYLNGVELTELRHTGWPATNIETLTFGATRFGTFTRSQDIWFDNLAVSATRIGCNR
jgi:hypothetical protein